MLETTIPDFGALRLEHLVLDMNGTLAQRGELLPGVREGLVALAAHVEIHVLTADTFGSARQVLAELPCTVEVLAAADQAEAKRAVVERLGAARTVAIGNGRNDRSMLAAARLGIAVILGEGAATAALQAADIVCTRIDDALALLREPRMLVATLRS
jgi:P-type E1-E2 ATPase